MVDEAGDILLTCVAVACDRAWRPREELELALGVERVRDGRRRDGTVQVKVIVASAALVMRPYPNFLATVTLEWDFSVVEFQLV